MVILPAERNFTLWCLPLLATTDGQICLESCHAVVAVAKRSDENLEWVAAPTDGVEIYLHLLVGRSRPSYTALPQTLISFNHPFVRSQSPPVSG